MDILKLAEKVMSMDDATWARHANPWSVYTRFTCLPLIVLAIWSRVWLGWWCLVPLALAIFWTWFNPRAFGKPASLDNWASKGVMGERIYLARKENPVAAHHKQMATALAWISGGGLIILIYGLVILDFWAVISGLLATVLPKVWFVDRMVWIYEDHHRNMVD